MNADEPRVPTEDEIQGFVRGLRPEQFETATTAVDGWPDPIDAADTEAFERFLLDELELAAEAFTGIATLHDGDRRRRYRMNESEDIRSFLDRIRAEALADVPVWGFAAVHGEAAMGDDVFDLTDRRQVERASRLGALRPSLNWYAVSVPARISTFGIIRREHDDVEIVRSTYDDGVAPYLGGLLPPF